MFVLFHVQIFYIVLYFEIPCCELMSFYAIETVVKVQIRDLFSLFYQLSVDLYVDKLSVMAHLAISLIKFQLWSGIHLIRA